MSQPPNGKRVADSLVVMSHQMLPEDANPYGSVHGGVILKHIDTTGGVAAMRHARTNVVTASIDRMDFLRPVRVGDLAIFTARLEYCGRTSMDVSVSVVGEDLITGRTQRCAEAILTYVALDRDGHPIPVPPLILETDEERQRAEIAAARRARQLAEKKAQHAQK
ncbi:acyl-CoA thioesterase [Megalodesulfovibrio paquesii]